jgi:hypothetical protein
MPAFPHLPIPVAAALVLAFSSVASGQTVEAKAWAIVLPQIEFRAATLDESIQALRAKSRELDPTRQGVNIVCMAPMPADKKLDLRLTNVPLHEALRYVAQLSGLRLSAEPTALILKPGERSGPPSGVRGSSAAQTASQMIVPQVEFRETTLPEALDYLVTRSRALDPRKQGVNIVLDVPPERREAKVTLSLRDVPLSEAVRYTAQLAGLAVAEEPYALVVGASKARPR